MGWNGMASHQDSIDCPGWLGCCYGGCGRRMSKRQQRDCMSTAIQNARDQVTQPVNIAVASDLSTGRSTLWHSSLLLKDWLFIGQEW